MRDSEHEVSEQAAQRFARGEATAEEKRQIVRHLLADCVTCKGAVRAFLAPPSSYEESFSRAQVTVDKELGKRKARRLLAEIDVLPFEQQELVVRNSRRFAVPELGQALVERSHAARLREPAAMWRDARLAVVAADAAAAAGIAAEPLLHDWRARAWAALANAHRLRSELPEADRAFATAFAHQEAGTGDPEVRGWICEHFFSLRLFRREFEAAIALAVEAAGCYRRAGNARGESAAAVKLGLAHIYAGNPEAAFEPLHEGLDLAERCGDAGLMRDATGNLVLCFVDLRRPIEAYVVFTKGEEMFGACAETLQLLKWRWQGAMIERDLGFLPGAAAHLLAVREGFLERGLRVEVADVSLDLAEVYLRLGDRAGVLRTIGETIPIYSALGATRELLGALLELGQMGRQGEQALAVLHDLAGRLRRSYRPEAG